MTFNNRFSAWTSFTPTFNTSNADGSIGNGTLSGLWRRSGDSIDITIRMIWGTTTDNGTGTFLISGPSSFAVDTSKIIGGNGGIISGYCFLVDNDDSSNRRGCLVQHSADSNIQFIFTPEGASSHITGTNPWTWAQNDTINLSITCPVLSF